MIAKVFVHFKAILNQCQTRVNNVKQLGSVEYTYWKIVWSHSSSTATYLYTRTTGLV